MTRGGSQSGFGLIEVLITLLVFSVGVLAVAGLQTISKKNNFDALQRTTAANLANAIVSSMRANPDALANYLVPTDTPLGSNGTPTAPEVDCYQSDCSPADLAAFDLYQWELALNGSSETVQASGSTVTSGGLANPSACITGPAGGGAGFYEIVIAWRGITPLSTDEGNTCGSDRGLYGQPTSSGSTDDTAYQRFFDLRTYIAP